MQALRGLQKAAASGRFGKYRPEGKQVVICFVVFVATESQAFHNRPCGFHMIVGCPMLIAETNDCTL